MTTELASGVLGVAGLSVLAYVIGQWTRSRVASFLLMGVLFVSLIFAWTCSGSLRWASLIPAASVVVWSNLMPILLGFAAGAASRANVLTRLSRPLTVFSIIALAMAYAFTLYLRPVFYPVELGPVEDIRDRVCVQTHGSTCAPAAAVTLLRDRGLVTTEKRMVEHCLTSSRGTEPLGLYRGLATVLKHSDHQARVASSDPDRWTVNNQLPNISLVCLTQGPSSGPSRWLLGPRGEGHAVVVFGRSSDGNWVIADPAFGWTRWTDKQFRQRFTGDAIYLADRFQE